MCRLFAWAVFLSFVLWGILFVVFGEVTVRRLRKDLQVRRQMGYEFFPGWDIVNVAVALSWPRRLVRWLDRGVFRGFRANLETMYRNTSPLDRMLARAFHGTIVFHSLWLALVGLVKQSLD